MKKDILIKYTAITAVSITAIIAVIVLTNSVADFFAKKNADPQKTMVKDEPIEEEVLPDEFPDFQEEMFLPLKRPAETGLTTEDEAESRAEIQMMQKALAGNMFIPGIGESVEEHKNRRKECIQLLSLGTRIVKNQGTPEDKRKYYDFKIRMTQDKIALTKYIIQRAEELEKEKGIEYLSEKDAQDGYNTIKELESEMATYQNMLGEIE